MICANEAQRLKLITPKNFPYKFLRRNKINKLEIPPKKLKKKVGDRKLPSKILLIKIRMMETQKAV